MAALMQTLVIIRADDTGLSGCLCDCQLSFPCCPLLLAVRHRRLPLVPVNRVVVSNSDQKRCFISYLTARRSQVQLKKISISLKMVPFALPNAPNKFPRVTLKVLHRQQTFLQGRQTSTEDLSKS